MKKILFFIGLIISVTLVQAYQTKSTPRSNFSPKPAENAEQVPGQQGVQTRTFSSYGARQGPWRREKSTKPVKTPDVTETKQEEKVFTPIPSEPVEKPASSKEITKKSADASVGSHGRNPGAMAAQKAAPVLAPATDSVTQQQPGAEAASAAMMDQMQGLQKMISGLGGAAGGDSADKAGGAGMPDLSSLLNAAGAGGQQQPKK